MEAWKTLLKSVGLNFCTLNKIITKQKLLPFNLIADQASSNVFVSHVIFLQYNVFLKQKEKTFIFTHFQRLTLKQKLMFLFHSVVIYFTLKQKQNVFVLLNVRLFGSETKTKCLCFLAVVFWPCWHSIVKNIKSSTLTNYGQWNCPCFSHCGHQ